MPRMLVNLAPSTVQFNDGESPLVSGLAHFGETMAKLPLQQAQIRMQQQREQDDRDQFAASNQLRMNNDTREQEQHDLTMRVGRGKAVEGGYIDPQPANEQMMTADEQNDQLLRAHGEDMRAAELAASQRKHEGHYTGFIPQGRDPFKMNTATGEVEAMFPEAPVDPRLAQVAHDNQIATDRQKANDAAQPGFFRGLTPSFYMGHHDDGASAAPASAAPPVAQAHPAADPTDLEFHAQNIHQLLQSGDTASAQDWISHMRADYGDEFTNAVKERVRAHRGAAAPAP